MHIDELYQSFLYSKEHGVHPAKRVSKPATLEMYRRFVGYFVNFVQIQRHREKYNDITRADVRAFIQHVNSRTDWSVSTKLSHLRALRALFVFVREDDECVKLKLNSWTREIGSIPRNESRKFIPSVKTLKDGRDMWNIDKAFGLRNFTAYCLVLGCGMRVGEICHLRLTDLLLDQKEIHVPREGKSGSRLVPLDAKSVDLVKKWLRRRERMSGAGDSPFVFIARKGSQCSPNTFGQAFRKAQPGSERGSRVTPHTLRHAFGTYYLRNGGGLERLRIILGHSTMDTTLRYSHLAEVGSKQGKEELERVSPLNMLNRK